MESDITRQPLDKHLGYWLRLVSNRVSGGFTRALQSKQVSVGEWVALNLIEHGAGRRSTDIAALTGMTRGALSKILDKLECKGWISRQTTSEDQRAQSLSLTNKGARALPQLAAIADGNDEHFFRCLTATERATLEALLRKLTAAHGIDQHPTE